MNIWKRHEPWTDTREMLVGHSYLAQEIVRRVRGGYPVSMPDIAAVCARDVAIEQDDPIPDRAEYRVQYKEDGYIITFAWVAWRGEDTPQ